MPRQGKNPKTMQQAATQGRKLCSKQYTIGQKPKNNAASNATTAKCQQIARKKLTRF